MAGFLMVAVVASIFTMADAARSVATMSAELHALDLVALSVNDARHDLGAWALLAAQDDEQASASAEATRRSLDELDQAVATGLLPAESELAEFGSTARAALAGDSGALERLPLLAERTTATLALEQADLLDRIEASKQQLRRIGSLGGFAVAFVVPLAAAYLYHQLTNRSAEAIEIDATMRIEIDRLRAENERRLHLLLSNDTDPALLLSSLVHDLQLEAGTSSVTPENIDLVPLVARVPMLRLASSEDVSVHTDQGALLAVLIALGHAAELSGRPGELEIRRRAQNIEISVLLGEMPGGPSTEKQLRATIQAAGRYAATAGITFEFEAETCSVGMRVPKGTATEHLTRAMRLHAVS